MGTVPNLRGCLPERMGFFMERREMVEHTTSEQSTVSRHRPRAKLPGPRKFSGTLPEGLTGCLSMVADPSARSLRMPVARCTGPLPKTALMVKERSLN